VDQDIRLLRESVWKNLALNGEKWKKLFEEGQGPHRAVEPVMMMMMPHQIIATTPCDLVSVLLPKERHRHSSELTNG
jgi:hypothetical protein